jgi:hypothetical protein
MIECIFTIDYEIYGNGEGSLRELVYDPAEKLNSIFQEANARFVTFVEAAELEMIEANATDDAIELVKAQVRNLYRNGFEIGLHLHPQWYNAHREEGKWLLDRSEYNLCTLDRERIMWIVHRAISYLRKVLNEPDFTPLSFRAGNWLFQPTETAASVLTDNGIRVDSSVFKGGLQHEHVLDYRPALKNGCYWNFRNDVNAADPLGPLMEIPIYTQMVPFWRMLTTKRVALQKKSHSAAVNALARKKPQRLSRLRDYLRFRYPLKFDFCRMTLPELISMIEGALQEDLKTPGTLKPLVAIGHTKDLVDFDTVEAFLSCLQAKGIAVSTLQGIYHRCRN